MQGKFGRTWVHKTTRNRTKPFIKARWKAWASYHALARQVSHQEWVTRTFDRIWHSTIHDHRKIPQHHWFLPRTSSYAVVWCLWCTTLVILVILHSFQEHFNLLLALQTCSFISQHVNSSRSSLYWAVWMESFITNNLWNPFSYSNKLSLCATCQRALLVGSTLTSTSWTFGPCNAS